MTRNLDNDEWLSSIGALGADVPDVDDSDPDVDADGQHADGDAAGEELFGGAHGLVPLAGSVDVVDLDSDGATATVDRRDRPPRRFSPRAVAALGVAAVAGTVVTLVVTVINSSSNESAAPSPAPVPPRTAQPAPLSLAPNADGPLSITASSDCAPGSTAAQSAADPNSTTPWVCVRSVDGQVLDIDLGRTFVITAVSIVPGAIDKAAAAGANQPDPWLQHRVVTRLQWQFNDTDRTVKAQNTGNVRGEAVQPVRPGVLASKITVIVQETSRPPVIAPSSTASAPPPGMGPSILNGILGGDDGTVAPKPVLPGAESPRDPADGTFAVSSIKVIGHKAV